MSVAFGIGVVGVCLLKKLENFLDDAENLATEDSNEIPLRAVMAMLVHATYSRDLNCFENGVAWLTDYNNKRADRYRKLHWTSFPCRKSQAKLKKLGLAILRRERSHSNPNAPALAIVMRGTIPSKPRDLVADMRIAVQRLSKSRRVRKTLKLVLEVVKEFRKENPTEWICMAGHSLGAATALIVGGILYYEYKINIDTHLFNAPLMTLVDVLMGKVDPWPTFPADSDGVRHAGVRFASWLKEMFVEMLGDSAAMDAEWAQFQGLRQWTPTCYINPWDVFCRRGKSVFETPVGTPGDVISLQGLLSKLFFQDSRYFRNVVPSAHVYISHWKEGHHILPHSLRQWHKYDPKHIMLEYFPPHQLG